MTLVSEHFMDDDDQILLRRFAEYVQPYSEKVLARTINCSERTAKHFRNGTSWPTARHWRNIIRAFGRDVVAAVFDPEINDTLARLRREERQLEERLEQARARTRQVAGGLDSPPQSGVGTAGRTAAGLTERRTFKTDRRASHRGA
jgi:hypothetical protein